MDVQLKAAVIYTGIPALATLLSACIAWFARRSTSKNKKLKSDLDIAISDIEFLLEAERHYRMELQFHAGSSMRNSIRDRVRTEAGFQWSGKYTPGRIRAKRESERSFQASQFSFFKMPSTHD